MKKIYFLAPLILLFFLIIRTLFFTVQAEEDCNLLCLETKIKDLSRQLELSQAATKPLEETLNKLEKDIKNIQNQITVLENGIVNKETELENLNSEIAKGDKELLGKQDLLSNRIRLFYIRSQLFSPFVLLLSKIQSSALIRELSFRESVTQKDKDEIIKTALFLKDIENKKNQAEILKAELEDETKRLASAKIAIDKQAQFFRKEVTGAKSFQSQLSSQLASLTEKQRSIISGRIESLNLPYSLGAGPLNCTDDRNVDPGFSPAFAFFTFGIPHRVGLNQYGAYGRANAGQSYKDILQAYFNGVNLEKKDNINIKVEGYGDMPLEQYLLGIYEMPGNWHKEALKAQVVAARSYALSYTNNGANQICTTQSCQVYKGGNKGGDWETAVHETEGEVITKDGQVVTAWYASTAGGYTFTSGDVGWNDRSWTKRLRDTNGDISNFSDLFNKAYDKDSPCFYSAQGYRREYNKSAWLKSEEVADIVNVILLARKDSSTREHLYQPDKDNPSGTDNWDADKVKQELRSRGENPFDNISDVSVSGVDFGVGRTTQITVKGNAGEKSFAGSEFSDFFNIRSPSNILIVGPLYNVEKK